MEKPDEEKRLWEMALQAFSERDRTIMFLRFVHGKRREEIAKALDVSVELVEERLKRIKRFLAELMPDETITIVVDPGTAPPEEIAGILSDLSRLYRKMGGNGINFSLEGIHVVEDADAL